MTYPAFFNEVETIAVYVLWFNFLAGFVYIATGVGLWLRRRWTVVLAVVLATGTALTFAAWSAITLFGWRVVWRRL